MKQNGIMKCRKCGREVCVIEQGIYRKILVDATAVIVAPDPEGMDFVRIDGSKVKGRVAKYDEQGATEYAYVPHARNCGGFQG